MNINQLKSQKITYCIYSVSEMAPIRSSQSQWCSAIITTVVVMTSYRLGEAANILLVPGNVGSHLSVFGQLGSWLVRRGHNVTSVHGSTMKIPQSYRDTDIRLERYTMHRKPYISTGSAANDAFTWALNFSITNVIDISSRMGENFEKECAYMFKDQRFMKAMRDSAFDVAISDNFPCFVTLGYKLRLPTIMFGTHCDPVVHKLPHNPAYVPHIMLSYTVPMNFVARMVNLLMYATNSLGQHMPMNKIVKKYVPERPLKNYIDIMADSLLCLQLRDPDVLSFVSPTMPNVVDVAGLMVRPGRPLISSFAELVTSARGGVVIVSFGSWISDMPTSFLSKLLAAFAKLDHLIIFKYRRHNISGSSPKLPANVRAFDWIPQNDLLSHPNVVLFVSHCGIGSLIESVHHGVPILAAPLMFDQHHNAGIVKTRGYGEIVDVSNFTPESFSEKAKLIIETPTYRTKVRQASTILKEKETFLPSGQVAAFRIEHVIKYGGEHLRSNAFELKWYQYFMLDMLLLLTFSFVFLVYIFKIITSSIVNVLKYSVHHATSTKNVHG